MNRRSGIFRIRTAFIVIVPIIIVSVSLAAPCYCMDVKPFAPWDTDNPASDSEDTVAQETDASVCGSVSCATVSSLSGAGLSLSQGANGLTSIQ